MEVSLWEIGGASQLGSARSTRVSPEFYFSATEREGFAMCADRETYEMEFSEDACTKPLRELSVPLELFSNFFFVN